MFPCNNTNRLQRSNPSTIIDISTSIFPPLLSTSATNNLAYLLARDALHTLAAAARQAPTGLNVGVAGTGLLFEDPSRRVTKVAGVSCQASAKVILSALVAGAAQYFLWYPREREENVGAGGCIH